MPPGAGGPPRPPGADPFAARGLAVGVGDLPDGLKREPEDGSGGVDVGPPGSPSGTTVDGVPAVTVIPQSSHRRSSRRDEKDK
jgi:hypothetical protein